MSKDYQDFELVGPNAGKTMLVNGHPFEKGKMRFHGSPGQIAVLTRVFNFYGAIPAELAELAALRSKEDTKLTRADVDKALSELPGSYSDAGYVVSSMSAHFGELFTPEDERAVRESFPKAPVPADVVAPEGKTPEEVQADLDAKAQAELDRAMSVPSLGEAIGSLDPEKDAHWTSNNLPAIDVLEHLTGKKVSRAEVDAVAEGYTRAKARAAKQQ